MIVAVEVFETMVYADTEGSTMILSCVFKPFYEISLLHRVRPEYCSVGLYGEEGTYGGIFMPFFADRE